MTVIGRGSLADAWLSDMHSPVESVVASRPPVGELCENATPLASIRASAMVANNSSVRLISTLPSFGGAEGRPTIPPRVVQRNHRSKHRGKAHRTNE